MSRLFAARENGPGVVGAMVIRTWDQSLEEATDATNELKAHSYTNGLGRCAPVWPGQGEDTNGVRRDVHEKARVCLDDVKNMLMTYSKDKLWIRCAEEKGIRRTQDGSLGKASSKSFEQKQVNEECTSKRETHA